MELFLIVIVTHFIALLSPGPDFFLILTTLLREGQRAAKYVCFGIVLGNIAVIALVFISLFMLGQLNHGILDIVKWGSIMYLSFLSYRCFAYARQADFSVDIQLDVTNQQALQKIKLLLFGIQSSILNPKNILFYGSIILAIYQSYTPTMLGLVSLWMICVVLFWNLFLIHLFSQKKALDWFQTKMKAIYYLSGLCFALFAAMMLLH
ncbi:MAG: Threonine efflux protein [Acinetobacter bereziniae]|uniref:Threonine efflux protein n=1 Tax=Acinetobacter bereziniae TaxID=106648 RepID=A0A833TUL3_ACIBZ|nr:MAG: Threonine efflux protein [Acinetobacter bereziniae]